MALALLLLVGIVMASLFRDGAFAVGTGMMATAESCLSVLLFLVAGDVASMTHRPAAAFGLAFTLPCVANVWLGAHGIPWLVGTLRISFSEFWGVASACAGLMLGIVLILFLTWMVTGKMSKATEKRARGDVWEPERLAVYACRRYGLTGRETDVLRLILEGNTLRKIPEALSISEGTVQTHTKNLYRKTGVHTRQELVDLVRGMVSDSQAREA